jgi:hypothetical protein
MKRFFLTLLFAALCATGYGQTLKSLMYNTTNGRVMYSGTNVLTFTNTIRTDRIESATVGSDAFIYFDSDVIRMEATAVAFEGPMEFYFPIVFQGTNSASVAAATRTNLALGATNNVAFRNITSDGNIANLIASNNTTISNETLFRVGTAEATNRSAQFGFRSTNTNGNGVAVFSVFGYNALAMIGPSARSATNTNAIEADIYSINPTNKVATLIDTNTGATLMHRPVGFATNASTPSSTNTIVGWIQFFVGTNSVRVPYYQ